jgi:hypothetical protein
MDRQQRFARTILLAIFLGVSCGVSPVAGETAGTTSVVGMARITYVSGSSIYIDAGREHGLEEGDTVHVVRDGTVVAELRVGHLSAIRASCTVVEATDAPTVGDVVRLPVVTALSEAPDAATPTGSDSIGAAELSEPADAATGTMVDTVGVPGLARVSNVDHNRVFIDSGQNKGLRGGDKLRVLRGNSTAAVLEVIDVSTDRASCKIVEGIGSLEVGDLVRLPIRGEGDDTGPVRYEDTVPETVFVVHAATEPVVPGAVPRAIKPSLSGRVGARYLIVRDRDAGGDEFSQPALDLRLDGNDLASGHFDLAVDVRSRRTYRSDVTGTLDTEDQTRVYRAAASVHDPRGRFRLTVGRQFSPSLASVSTFDGAMAAFDGNKWSTGLFGGTQPDPVDYGYAQIVKEYGAFVQLHNRPGASAQWSVTTGAIGSYVDGIVNREYAYLQGLFTSRRVSFYATHELDYNRDWKIDLGEDQVELTSSYVHLGLRASKGLNLSAGYDNRRNIRLYRDLITPETDFDDSFREGVWVGFTQRIAKRFRFGLSGKRSTGGTSGNADSYTLILGANRLARRLNFFYRGTSYANDTNEGSLQSLTTGIGITRRVRMTLSGGLRQDTVLLVPENENELLWYGMEMDFTVGRHWFLQISGERTEGELEQNDQGYFSTTYRF